MSTYFHHRSRQASVVIGNTLYWDGGEIATWNRTGSGYANESAVSNVKDPNTYYIDLTTSWSNSNAPLVKFPKDGPLLESQALWANNSEQAFSYNGGISQATYPFDPIPPNSLWALAPSSSPRWSQVTTTGNFTSLVRTLEGSYASGGGLGFALGGFQSEGTTQTAGDFASQWVPGMVVYNMSQQSWYNVSAGGDYGKGSSNGVAHLAQPYGPAGILLALGGTTPYIGVQTPYIGLDRVSLYEPLSQQWRTQRTSGDIPNPVISPCVVGAAGDNNTYELFFYGGLHQTTSADTQDSDSSVYILSLPAFHWFKIAATGAQGRYRHSCNAVGRQMISIGGIVVPGAFSANNFALINGGLVDPWANALGIFDMTSLQWSTSYQSEAGNYTTADVVKSYYAKNSMYPSSFDNADVKTWFTGKTVTSTNTTSSPSTSSTSTSSSQPTSGTNAGAIAGGVVGGLAVIILVILAIWLFRRRQRRRQAQQPHQSYRYHTPNELPSNSIGEMPEGQTYHETEKQNVVHQKNASDVQTQHPVYELEHPQRHEL